jgi:FkbM family methyltransferase
MKQFSLIEGAIRRNFYLYLFLRKLAPAICSFVPLEDGFDFLKLIRPNNSEFTALDIGANDGTSIRMIRKFHRNTRIESFDPIVMPKFKLKNVNFHQIGLSNRESELEIFSPIVRGRVFPQYSSIFSEKIIKQITSDMKVRKLDVSLVSKIVQLKTIDSFSLKPYFMKIDVEGAELHVLEGAKNTIEKFLPVILVEIQNKEMYQQIESFMHKLSYYSIRPNEFISKEFGTVSLAPNLVNFQESTNNYVWVSREVSPAWRLNLR